MIRGTINPNTNTASREQTDRYSHADAAGVHAPCPVDLPIVVDLLLDVDLAVWCAKAAHLLLLIIIVAVVQLSVLQRQLNLCKQLRGGCVCVWGG